MALKFHFFFIDSSEIWKFHSLFIYSTPLEISCPQPSPTPPPPPPPSPTVWIFLENGIAKLIKTDVPVVQQRHELFWVFGKKVKQINNLIHC